MLGTKVRLREKKLTDARSDYRWQTNPELVRLDAMPLLTISLPRYLLDYTMMLGNPSPKRRTFGIDTLDGRHIGNCVYYNIDREKEEAERAEEGPHDAHSARLSGQSSDEVLGLLPPQVMAESVGSERLRSAQQLLL